MSSASIDTKIIETFLATSAVYLGVNMHDLRVNNFDSPVTVFAPERLSSGRNANQMPSQHGDKHNA